MPGYQYLPAKGAHRILGPDAGAALRGITTVPEAATAAELCRLLNVVAIGCLYDAAEGLEPDDYPLVAAEEPAATWLPPGAPPDAARTLRNDCGDEHIAAFATAVAELSEPVRLGLAQELAELPARARGCREEHPTHPVALAAAVAVEVDRLSLDLTDPRLGPGRAEATCVGCGCSFTATPLLHTTHPAPRPAPSHTYVVSGTIAEGSSVNGTAAHPHTSDTAVGNAQVASAVTGAVRLRRCEPPGGCRDDHPREGICWCHFASPVLPGANRTAEVLLDFAAAWADDGTADAECSAALASLPLVDGVPGQGAAAGFVAVLTDLSWGQWLVGPDPGDPSRWRYRFRHLGDDERYDGSWSAAAVQHDGDLEPDLGTVGFGDVEELPDLELQPTEVTVDALLAAWNQ